MGEGTDAPTEQVAAADSSSVDPNIGGADLDTTAPPDEGTPGNVTPDQQTDSGTENSTDNAGSSDYGGTAPRGSESGTPAGNTEDSTVLLARIAGWSERLDELTMAVIDEGTSAGAAVAAARDIVRQAEQLYQQEGLARDVRGRAACVIAKGHTTMGSDVDNLRSVGIWARRGLDLYADQPECAVFADMAN